MCVPGGIEISPELRLAKSPMSTGGGRNADVVNGG